MRYAARNILIGQIVLYAGLVVCILLKPSGLEANSGVSYYGIFRKTFLPYAVALLGGAYFTARAELTVPHGEPLLRLALKIYAILIVGIAITPFAASQWLDYVHIACGAALFSLQLLLSGWLIRRHCTWWNITLGFIELAAGIMAALYLPSKHGFLIQSQIVFQFAFGVLLILSLHALDKPAAIHHKQTPLQEM